MKCHSDGNSPSLQISPRELACKAGCLLSSALCPALSEGDLSSGQREGCEGGALSMEEPPPWCYPECESLVLGGSVQGLSGYVEVLPPLLSPFVYSSLVTVFGSWKLAHASVFSMFCVKALEKHKVRRSLYQKGSYSSIKIIKNQLKSKKNNFECGLISFLQCQYIFSTGVY